MLENYLSRLINLYGEEKISSISDKVILLAGLGGVGGATFVSLIRSGFKHLIIVDYDKVEPSNLNRQILYTKDDCGLDKTLVAKRYASLIDETIEVTTINKKISAGDEKIFAQYKIDFIVDAIDDIKGKITLINYALENDIPLISSMGMGLRKSSGDICITSLDKTYNDPLARKLRSVLRKQNLNSKAINVVFSIDKPIKQDGVIASSFFAPNIAGIKMAEFVFNHFIEK